MAYHNDKDSIRAAQEGDREVLSQIVESNMGLVKAASRRFWGRGTDPEDLIQIGTIGMIKAIRRFDLSTEHSFTTYAVAMIIGEIRRFLRDDGLIKISRTAKTNHGKIQAFLSEYRNCHHCDPGVAAIAQGTGLNQEDVIFALEAHQPVLSLVSRESQDDPSLENLIGEDSLEEHFDSIALGEAIRTLSPEAQKLIHLRYYKQLTQSQTAAILGMSQVKVSREEKKICEKLRKELSG